MEEYQIKQLTWDGNIYDNNYIIKENTLNQTNTIHYTRLRNIEILLHHPTGIAFIDRQYNPKEISKQFETIQINPIKLTKENLKTLQQPLEDQGYQTTIKPQNQFPQCKISKNKFYAEIYSPTNIRGNLSIYKFATILNTIANRANLN